MKNNLIKSLFILTFVVLFSSTGLSQSLGVVGKIFTKTEANQKFGRVLNSVQMNTKLLMKLAEKTPEYVLFKVKNNHLIVLNKKRKVISGNVKSVSKSEVFHLFSTQKLIELIQKGNSPITTFEVRSNDILSVTSGAETLEESLSCPPFCN